MSRCVLNCMLVLHIFPSMVGAQAPLPVVADVEWKSFLDRTRKLLKGLESLQAPLPEATLRELRGLLEKEPASPQAAAEAVQKLLDPYCLVGITINPESRVKAARGPAGVELPKCRETILLIKVQNDAGVTHALNISGDQITAGDKPEDGRWLKAVIVNDELFPRKLSGQRIDYLVLKLTALEGGKREATLRFDVGQGTQDLGFRGEVPILFRVK
jgi:hypothetical protein